MNKTVLNILKIIITYSILFYGFNIFAYDKVEDIFIDIDKNYIYYSELQSLYDKGMITPDKEKKFNPNKLLSRDEFVGIVMEVGCSKCIKPNTALEYILKYGNNKVFFDVEEDNDYFYCISEAYNKDVVKGYSPSYVCQDGTTSVGEIPFCKNNNITLEEAVAVLLRNSSVFTIKDNNDIIAQIIAGNNLPDLSKDVKTKSLDGNIYTFYGYFKKALELSYSEYDLYGNLKKYSIVSLDSNGNINPKKYITKQDFLKMAYIISKVNSCSLGFENTFKNTQIAGEIDIYDKVCKSIDKNCNKSDLKDSEGIYDFDANVNTKCDKGIKDYIWMFYNKDTKETYEEKGKYIDNYKFKSYGIWQIKLTVTDNCGNQVELYNEISYLDDSKLKKGDNNLGLSIKANPVFGYGPLKVDFESIVKNCNNCKYEWTFGDGNKSNLKNPNNTFLYSGVYEVELIITDENGNKARATVVIRVDDNVDSDGDGIFDDKDKCIYVYGEVSNSGCPILDQTCLLNSENNPCKNGYICNKKGFCEVDNKQKKECIYSQNSSSIFGNAVCDTCPCDYKVDFLSTLRKCDIIFPAIVSPDGSEVYSKGNLYQIPYK